MSTRTASIVSVILSLLLLVIFAVLAVIFEIIALNGATGRQGITALGISMTCLAAGAIPLGVLAWKVSAFLITRFDLNPSLAVLMTVMFGMLISGGISFLAILVSISLAGIQ